MDAADVRNLYEAYRSVYEDREYLNEDYDYDLYDSEGYILDEAQRIMKVTSPSGGVKYKEGKTIGRIRDALGRLPADKREISNREARDRELDRRVEASRKSITRLNAQSNNKRSERGIQSLTTGGSHYLEVPTDYRARRRRAHESVDLYDVVLDHLLDEGYCDDVDSAEIIMANMSEEWLDEIVEGFVSPYKTKPTYGNPQGTSPAMKAMQKSDELQRTEPGSPRQKMQTRRSQQMNRMFQAARRA